VVCPARRRSESDLDAPLRHLDGRAEEPASENSTKAGSAPTCQLAHCERNEIRGSYNRAEYPPGSLHSAFLHRNTQVHRCDSRQCRRVTPE
jgi:hypothetical protein